MSKISNRDFAHLHLHTDHSFLDGVGRAEEYVSLAAGMGQTAIACTDHGGLHGLPAMRRACREHGLKLIPGCELYVNDEREKSKEVFGEARKRQKEEGGKQRNFLDPEFADAHLVVLAVDQTGWQNLLSINHDSVNNGYYYKPRTTHKIVCEHSGGLVATTACMGSLFGQYASRGELKKLRALLEQFRDAFGERFFYELHVNEIPDQKNVNGVLIQECGRLGIEPILTCDVHYACAEDTPRQDEMLAIARRKTLDDADAFRLTARHLWFSSPRDIILAAKQWDMGFDRDLIIRAIANTGKIAAMTGAEIYSDTKLKPPAYIDDSGNKVDDPFTLLQNLAVRGLKEKFGGGVEDKYRERLIHELAVIRKLGMSAFYLVTLDVVQACRKRGVVVWTRGSGCGSLVAACVGITPIDPLKFGLLFERFVDPSRPNAPDFDLDIDATRRAEIVEWLYKKYGGENGANIARIISLNTFRMKSAIQGVCCAHGHERKSVYKVSDLCDNLEPSIEKALSSCTVAERPKLIEEAFNGLMDQTVSQSPERNWLDENETLVKASLAMTGRVRGKGLHAAGYVVAPSSLEKHLPIDRATDPVSKEPIVITAWGEGQATQDIAETGLLKLDLLALETVSVVSECYKLVKERHGIDLNQELDTWKNDFDDPETMREFGTGNGFGLHQLNESSQQLAQVVGRMKPKNVSAIVAAVALYRPGPMQFIDDYILRLRGKRIAGSLHPDFDAITSETFGIMVYQEQVMQVLNVLGGIPLRDAYSTIKAISKKKLKDIQQSREQFIRHAMKSKGISEEIAKRIFDNVEKFAGYGFNKAHAASYAVLSYITAYLRAHFPLEFWYAWLQRTDNKSVKKRGRSERKLEIMMQQARIAGVKLRPPDVKKSSGTWRIASRGNVLLAPLSILMGVGENSAQAIAKARREKFLNSPGPCSFGSIWDFLSWVDKNRRVCSATVVRALAKGNAFLGFGMDSIEASAIADYYLSTKDNKKSGTRTEQTRRAHESRAIKVPERSTGLRLKLEREAFGFNFFTNPWTVNNREELLSQILAKHKSRIVIGEPKSHGMYRPFAVTRIHRVNDRNNRAMAFVSLLSVDGSTCEGVVFSSVWKDVEEIIRVDGCYIIRGEYSDGKYLVGYGRTNHGPVMRRIESVKV